MPAVAPPLTDKSCRARGRASPIEGAQSIKAKAGGRSKADVCERMRRWRAENVEKNRENDMRCRVYRLARQHFGQEDSEEKRQWIQNEITRRTERRKQREAAKSTSISGLRLSPVAKGRDSHSPMAQSPSMALSPSPTPSTTSPVWSATPSPAQNSRSPTVRSESPTSSPLSLAASTMVTAAFAPPAVLNTLPVPLNRSISASLPSLPPLTVVEPQCIPRGPPASYENRGWLKDIAVPLTSTLGRYGLMTASKTTTTTAAHMASQPSLVLSPLSSAASTPTLSYMPRPLSASTQTPPMSSTFPLGVSLSHHAAIAH
ncbi:hypothetical protein H4R34_000804 [Dimargaris verticillata]|uniref:DUF3020 domain-containing protein n=1 Tax=Dimargaris verticillata TaxID=2761393 RepID=A0A9W8B5K2_9FUNG|nr:hypothetical protein H4R34_000804 [Dimargaris verticillata]